MLQFLSFFVVVIYFLAVSVIGSCDKSTKPCKLERVRDDFEKEARQASASHRSLDLWQIERQWHCLECGRFENPGIAKIASPLQKYGIIRREKRWYPGHSPVWASIGALPEKSTTLIHLKTPDTRKASQGFAVRFLNESPGARWFLMPGVGIEIHRKHLHRANQRGVGMF